MTRRWNLTTKLAATGAVFLALALASIALTIWVTWRLEGGAAAVNEAGRMRMQAYRLVLTQQVGTRDELRVQTARFERSLQTLREGDPSRPLFVPWNAQTRAHFKAVQAQWERLKGAWAPSAPDGYSATLTNVDEFVGLIDHFVSSIEQQLSSWIVLLNAFQMAMMVLAIGSAVVLMYTGYLFVLNPLSTLQQGLERLEQGDFTVRVQVESNDEFGRLARGFNQMARNLQSLYQSLEAKVAEKTAGLELKRTQLASLYEISAFIASAESLDDLAQGFAKKIRRIAQADAVAVRWSDEANQRYWLLASECLPASLIKDEACVHAGDCHCGPAFPATGMRLIPIRSDGDDSKMHCAQEGFQAVISVPVNLHQRCVGEVDLFYRSEQVLTDGDRSMLETMATHLAGGMESIRAAALEKETAVAQERGLLARELHDSIAQSLAFMKIQVQLLRDAVKRVDQDAVGTVIGELDTGIRECYSDVRELLMHFRTRTNAEAIEPALRTTLQKFEHQTGLQTHLNLYGHGMPLPPDVQVQVLHVVQEALSNVRKHAVGATQVWLEVQQSPRWCFEVRDNGQGFDTEGLPPDQTHVGLMIMQERAERVGADLDVDSVVGEGTRVTLTLPALIRSDNAQHAAA
ncbi:MAG: type IV pili methyl-accepting chemotaxis transducer N-terminal domain-containing protein [Burkholderiales bacterium]|nr:type IV pili methyl-accepting chemotaxis transducer N-terminal domain-containing protein [Burkholderiales bacterium]